MREYLRTVAAYLTGWVIAQTIFTRLWKWSMREQRGKDWEEFHHKIAVGVAEELERLRTGEGYQLSKSGVDTLVSRIMGELPPAFFATNSLAVKSGELSRACYAAFQGVLDEAGVKP